MIAVTPDSTPAQIPTEAIALYARLHSMSDEASRIAEAMTEVRRSIRQCLQRINAIVPEPSRAPVQVVIDRTCEEFGVSAEALVSRRRPQFLVDARQAAMALCYELLPLHSAGVALVFGGRVHGCTLWATKAVSDKCATDPVYCARVTRVRRRATQDLAALFCAAEDGGRVGKLEAKDNTSDATP